MILGDLSDTKRVEALHPLLGKLSVVLKSMIFFPIRLGVSNWTVIEFSSTTIIRYYVLNRNRL